MEAEGLKFGQAFANQIRRRLPTAGDKWHMDEVVITISGVKHWLWRAVDQTGTVLDILVQSRWDMRAAKRLLRKLLKRQCRAPRVLVTDKLASYGAGLSRGWGYVDGGDTTCRAVACWGSWMGLVLRLVETRADGGTRSIDLLELSRLGDLRDIADLGLTLPEAKQLLARIQQAAVAAQARDCD